MESILRLLRDDSGQDLVEYALLVALIAIVVVAAIVPLGEKVSSIFSRMAVCLTTPGSPC